MVAYHRSILCLCLLECTIIVTCLITTQLYRPRHAFSRFSLVASKSSVSNEVNTLQEAEKSPESGFWWAAPQTTSPKSSLPAINGIDRETGPLPPGAYQTESNVCLIGVKIRPPLSPKEGGDLWAAGVKNCQKMIDNGFNSFSVGNSHGGTSKNVSQKKIRQDRMTKKYLASTKKLKEQYTARTMERHEFETHFYKKLGQNTPSSVSRSCHFAVDLEIPSILHIIDPTSDRSKSAPSVPYGNGWVVRKSISDALLRVKTESLDSVNLEYNPNSPYHLDTLNTLCEMKVEGLIKSISTRDFPTSLLQSALECGFDIYANNQDGNLLNIGHLNSLQSETESMQRKTEYSRILNAPLAGGLLTSSFSLKEDIRQLTLSEKKLFDACCVFSSVDRAEKWKRYREVIATLRDVAFRYKVSVESVALRWLLQIDSNNAILVGTKLGMDFAEEQGGMPFKRHSELRQVFSFSLDEEDIERLNAIAGFSKDVRLNSTLESDPREDFIDFNDKSLWI